MNTNKIQLLKKLVVGGLIILFPFIMVSGEVRSGFWIVDRMNRDTIHSRADFSELTAFCSAPLSAPHSVDRCSVRVADCF
jgi:hypothetical protein